MNPLENKRVKMKRLEGKKERVCQIYTIEDNNNESKSKEKKSKSFQYTDDSP